MWAAIEGPARGWTDRWVLAGITAATLILSGLGYQQRHTQAPLLPHGVLRNRSFTAAATVLTGMFFALFGFLFVVTLYLQLVLGYSPAQAGLRVLPLAGAAAVGAALSLPAMARWGARSVMVSGMLLVAAGFGVLARMPPTSGYGHVLSFQLVSGLGAGLAAAPATETVMNAIPAADTAAALNDLLREVGGALGIAVLGSALTTALNTHTGAQSMGDPVHDPLLGTTPFHPLRALTIRDAFNHGMHSAAWIAATVSLVAAATACWLPTTGRGTAHRPPRLAGPTPLAPRGLRRKGPKS